MQYNLIQSDGSVKRKWTSFDLQTKEEKNLEKLENKNLEIDTLNFIDTTHIAVGGKVNNEGDYETLYYTDISTGKTKEYTECGNVTPEWNCDYSVKKKTALFQNIVTGKEFLIKDIETNPSYSISIYKDYFLIWNALLSLQHKRENSSEIKSAGRVTVYVTSVFFTKRKCVVIYK